MLPPMNVPKPPEPEAAKPDPAAAAQEAVRRAEAAMKARHLGEAVGICQDVLEALPGYPPALALLGSILGHQGEAERAIDLLRRACAGYDRNASWFNNLATLCRVACRLDEALAAAERAMALAPGQPGIVLNLAKVRLDRGEHDAALGGLLDVLAREPENAEAHLALGQILLMRGDTHAGWYRSEWRNRLEQARGTLPPMPRPQWNGMRLPGSPMLLVGDQGFGDTIQFARLIPRVAERVGKVYLGAAPELEALLRPIPGVAGCYHRWQDIPAHSVYCRLSSVPALTAFSLAELPGKMPYLAADTALVETWRGRLDERIGPRRPRVGLVWAGRTTHPNDRRRSLRLGQLAPILAQRGVSFVSLQRPVPPRDAAEFAAMPHIIDLAAELTDFSVTAAIMANLDLVITVDSSVAHLAGALGRPGWVLMPRPADWRWLAEGTESAWYPSLRLFRQPAPGDWAPAIATAAWSLSRLAQPPATLTAAD